MSKPVRKLSAQERAEHARYRAMVKERAPRSRTALRCALAFVTGGAVCCLGQLTGDLGEAFLGVAEEQRGSFVSVVLIVLAALLTGLGVYDKIGRFSGAGSVVPITGFSNSVAAPAMEHRAEGIVTGVCAQLFTIAGPVLVFGIVSSAAVGLLTLFFDLFRR